MTPRLSRRQWLQYALASAVSPGLIPSLHALAEEGKGPSENLAAAQMGGIPLWFNEDASHFFISRAGRQLTPDLVDALVDRYAGTQVGVMLFNPNSMRTSYASQVWDPIWKGYDPQGPDDQPLFASTPVSFRRNARAWVHTAWQLNELGIDPYVRWIASCRRWNISPWISLRMNDLHNTNDPFSYTHSDFWLDNPQFQLPPDLALDYAQPEVRQYVMRLIQEVSTRYDFDGLELDWMRFPHYFARGQEDQGSILLGGFISEVRQILDQWQSRRRHSIHLSVRVPSRPQAARGHGLDAVQWAKAGLVDTIVVTPFFFTIEYDMPLQEWRTLLGGTGVRLVAGLEINLRPFPNWPFQRYNSLRSARGAAASLLDLGADGIYLFNYSDAFAAIWGIQDYQSLLQEVGQLSTLVGKPRRHVLTYPDAWAPDEIPQYPLPVRCLPWETLRFQVPTGPISPDSRVRLRLGINQVLVANVPRWSVQVNETPCVYSGIVISDEPRYVGLTYEFAVPREAIRRSYNTVTVFPGDLPPDESVQIEWVEFDFQPSPSFSPPRLKLYY